MKIKNVMGAKLTLDNGDTVSVERLGKGMFHTCYLDPSAKLVYSVTIERDAGTDYSKEVLAECDENPHIPLVERLGYVDGSDRRVYRMPLHQPMRAKRHPKAWGLLKRLIQARDDAWTAICDEQVIPRKMRHDDVGSLVNQRVCELMDAPGVPQSLKDALYELQNAACNYGSAYVFEFSKRNVMVDDDGTLILLDVLFSLEAVNGIRNAQQKKAGRW